MAWFTSLLVEPFYRWCYGRPVVWPAASVADGAADVRSWVRADRAELDVPLHDAVSTWLADAWPFTAVQYAPRPAGGGAAPSAGA